MYDPKSLKADEFIDHQEILDTLQYAEEHKHDVALIDSILEKARPPKDRHRLPLRGPHPPGGLGAFGLRHPRED